MHKAREKRISSPAAVARLHGSSSCLPTLLVLLSAPWAWGFSTNQCRRRQNITPSTARWNCQQRVVDSSTALDMVSPDQVEEILRELIDETATLSTSITPADEAAMLTDLAEVSSDIVILSSAPETVILRLTAVIEKILELLSDYIPDHTIREDELLFNVPVVAMSLFLLFRSAEPILKAQYVELDDMDLTVFELCFQPVGVTLLQFKCMKATGCFEWMDYVSGKVLIDENEYDISSLTEDDDTDQNSKSSNDRSNVGNKEQSSPPSDWKYLYWQYSGHIIKSFKGNIFSSIERNNGMHIDYPGAQGLLGDTSFLYLLEEESRQKQKQRRVVDDAISDNYQSLHPIATVTIGKTGAKLLRIDSHKLFDLMDRDERLESSIRLLLLKSLKLKIGNLLFALHDDNDVVATDSQPVVKLGDEKIKKPPL